MGSCDHEVSGDGGGSPGVGHGGGGGAVTGASADMTGILHRGAVAPAAPAATLPTEATTATTTTTSLAAALPTTGGGRGLREADILATTAMADSPATTEEVVSETVNVPPTSSAVIFVPATNAQDQTIMVDQTSLSDVHLGVQLFDIYLDI